MDGGFSDCTGTCEPVMDHAQHYIGGTDLNNMDGANSARYGANGGSLCSDTRRGSANPQPAPYQNPREPDGSA